MVINCKRGGNICIGKTAIIFDYDSTNLFIDTIHEATGKANLLHRITTIGYSNYQPGIYPSSDWNEHQPSGTCNYQYDIYELYDKQPSGSCNFKLEWESNKNAYIVTGSHTVKINSIRGNNESVVDYYNKQLKYLKHANVIIDSLVINGKQRNIDEFKVVYRRHTNFAVELKIKARPNPFPIERIDD